MGNSPWGLLGDLIRPNRRALGAYGAVLSCATALPLVGALLLARFVDLAAAGAPARRLVPLAAAYAGIGLVASLVTVVVTWRATTLAWRITDGLRHTLARRVLGAGLDFHRDRTPGELVSRADADVTAMTQFLSQVVARVIAIIALGFGALVVAVVTVPELAPVLAVGLAAIGWTTWAQRNSANDVTASERRAEAEVMGIAEQYLAAADEVAALGGGAHGVGRVAQASDVLVRAVGRRTNTQMRVQGGIRLSIVFAQVLMIGAGAAFASRGWVSLAGVFLGHRLVVAVRQPVESLTWRLQEAQGASGAARRVLDLLAETERLPDGDRQLPPGPLDIEFRGVELVYDDEADPRDRDQDPDPDPDLSADRASPTEDADDDEQGPVAAVQRLDLHLPAGRALGLIGRSGSGKTSIARLALRLVAPTSGTVFVGGVDLATVVEDDLRRRVAAVPQDVQLFPASVADNVRLFAPQRPGEPPAGRVVTDALHAAGLGDWLDDLPAGVDTLIDPDGRGGDPTLAGLSAGEAQLLALARALVRNPDIVVLDEATSRVDPLTQDAIMAATRRLIAGRTAIIIAHRLETLECCDDIAVLGGGRVLEAGPRAALAADPESHYAHLLATSAGAAGIAGAAGASTATAGSWGDG